MALRKLHAERVGQCEVKVYRDAEWDEYVVKVFVDGQAQGGSGGGYHTHDKQDAIETAAAEVERLISLGC